MADKLAHIVFTDPPYNVPIEGHVSKRGKHREFAMASGEMSQKDFGTFLSTSLGHAAKYSAKGSIHFIFMDWRHAPDLEKPKGKTCEAINGITDEGAEIMKEYKKSPALDAGLLAAAQAVEHYEISRYGTLQTWAEELGHSEAASLLGETLTEEKETDEKLTEIAKTAVNAEAEA